MINAQPIERSTSGGVQSLRPHDRWNEASQPLVPLAQADVAAVQVSLITPPSAFAESVAVILRRIDPRCRVWQIAWIEALATRTQKGLVLIDLDALIGTAEAPIQCLRASRPGTPIVALSSATDPDSVDRALHAGATAYLPKTYSEPLIEGVLRLVMGGEGYRPAGARRPPVRRGRPRKQAAAPSKLALNDEFGLTDRETDVLAQIAQGCPNLEIAKRLGMMESTVKRHVYNIFGKLNVQNRAEAALFGARMAGVQRQQIKEAEQPRINLAWLQAEMAHRRMCRGQTVFRAGDVGNALYYVQRGTVQLPEMRLRVRSGEVFGEADIFTRERRRMCSAVCESDVDLFSLTSEQVKRIYFANPQFAFFMLRLITSRLTATRQHAAA